MKDPIKVYPTVKTPFDRTQPMPIQVRLATAFHDMGKHAVVASGSTFVPRDPTYGAFLLRQRARSLGHV